MKNIRLFSLTLLTLALTACGGGGSSGGSSDGSGGSSGGGGSGTPVTTSGSPLAELSANTTISLANCGGEIASDVPDFYKTYFLCTSMSMSGDGNSVTMSFHSLPPYSSPYYSNTHPNWISYATDQSGKTLCTGMQTPGTGGCYRQNPNTLAQHTVTLTIPLHPVARGIDVNANASMVDNTSGDPYDYNGAVVGVAANGVNLFSGFAAPGDNILDEQYTFDSHYSHPQNSGYYHYHQWSSGPLEVMKQLGFNTSSTPGAPGSGGIEFYGIMCDGTLVFGATELDGSTPGNDLDAQGGHTHDIVDRNGITQFSGRYHVHLSPAKIGSNSKAFQFVPELQYYNSCSSSG